MAKATKKTAKTIAAALSRAVEKSNQKTATAARKTAAKAVRTATGTSSTGQKKGTTTTISTTKKNKSILPQTLKTTKTASPKSVAGSLKTGLKTTGQGTTTKNSSAKKTTKTAVSGTAKGFTQGVAKADVGTKTAQTLTEPYTAQYLPLTDDFRISSPYGVDRVTHRHSGIDLAVPQGTQVAAAKTGKVSFAGWGNGYGYRIVVDHLDGTQTTYNHLSDIGVKVGDTVRAGNTIALSGNTGNSTGPHLHFEVKKNGQYVDPELYFDFGNGIKAAGSDGYASQMASASGSSSASSGSSSSASASSSSGNSGSKSGGSSSGSSNGRSKSKSVALPSIGYTTATPKLTAYSPGKHSRTDYFSATMNPLLSLMPSYRHDGVSRS